MQVVRTVVDSQLVALPLQGELPLGNTVAVPTDSGTKKRFRTVDNVVDGVVTQDDVSHAAFAVGHHDS